MQLYREVKDSYNHTLTQYINTRYNIKQDIEYILANSDCKCLSHDSNYIIYQYKFMFVDDKYEYHSCYYLVKEHKETHVQEVLPYVL